MIFRRQIGNAAKRTHSRQLVSDKTGSAFSNQMERRFRMGGSNKRPNIGKQPFERVLVRRVARSHEKHATQNRLARLHR